MKNLNFRLLTADEIGVRVTKINEYGAELTLYKNARVDQQLLDEAVGPFGWKREHREVICGDEIRQACAVSLWDKEKNQWVSKEDFGSSDFSFEKEKASASDSFKRACTNWGIGRELYTAPTITLKPTQDYTASGTFNGGITTYDEFKVLQLCYDEEKRCITALAIKNVTLGKTVFTFNERSEENVLTDRINAAEAKSAAAEKKEQLLKKAEELGVDTDTSGGKKNVTSTPNTPDHTPSVSKKITPIPSQDEEPARCDVGGSQIFGRLLSDLKPMELLYCYKNTKTQLNKKTALNIARTNSKYADVFTKNGIAI